MKSMLPPIRHNVFLAVSHSPFLELLTLQKGPIAPFSATTPSFGRNETYRCLLAICGIGPKTAFELVISIDIDDFPSHGGLASYCGLAPRNRQSSTSVSSMSASRQGSKRLKNPSHSRATAWRARMGARAGATRGAAPGHKVGCAARRGLRELVRIPRPIDELRVDETIGTPHDFAKAVRYSQANGGEYFCKRYVRNLVSFGTVVACGCKIPRTSRADSCDHACLFWHKSYARGCVRSIPQ